MQSMVRSAVDVITTIDIDDGGIIDQHVAAAHAAGQHNMGRFKQRSRHQRFLGRQLDARCLTLRVEHIDSKRRRMLDSERQATKTTGPRLYCRPTARRKASKTSR